MAIAERSDLMGMPDERVVEFAGRERRAIVTRDLGDYRPLLAQAARSGAETFGLVCLPARIPLNRGAVGNLVRALDDLLGAYPGDDAAIRHGGEIWLPSP